MNETTILLAPAPKAKGDFLATVEPLGPPTVGGGGSGGGGDELPFEVTLDNYTRDPWGTASPPDDDPTNWRTVWLKSVDGRRKLPGFLKFLRERKKSAFGKFEATTEDGSSATRAVMVVPFDQPKPPAEVLEGIGDSSADEVVCCRYALDERKVKGLFRPPPPKQQQQQRHPQQPGQSQSQGRAQRMPQPPPQKKAPAPAPTVSKVRVGGKSGLLGNLLGASRRTNEHLNVVPVQKKKEASSEGADGGGGGEFGPAAGTSGAAISQFRTKIEQQLLDFQKSGAEVCVKIKVSLGEVTRDLPQEQKDNVTMDVLKFVLYEQADEIGEEKWIAQKEPTEFLDEMVVAVFKEGHAPEEVLEDMNKGELPDEIRLQQRAMMEARTKELARKEAKHDKKVQQKMLGGAGQAGGDDFAVLNTAKRDRRTIEEIQSGMGHETKRGRTE